MKRHQVFLFCIVSLFACESLLAVDLAEDIVKVEEHWELCIREPDVASVSPQISNSFAPLQQGNILYATFNVNNRLVHGKEFAAGGLQLQLWHGEYLLGTKTSDKNDMLQTPGEHMKWKQVITVDGGLVRFSIVDGESETFGTFGGLSLGVWTNLASLNDYRPMDSVDHSGAVFAANRVNYLRLTKVIATKRNGEIQEIVVPQHLCEACEHAAEDHHHHDDF